MYSFRTEYRNYSCLIIPFPSCLQIQVFGFSSPAVSSSRCCTAVLKAHVLPARCCVSHLYSCLFAPAGEACREHVVQVKLRVRTIISSALWHMDVIWCRRRSFLSPSYVRAAAIPSLNREWAKTAQWRAVEYKALPLPMSSWTGYEGALHNTLPSLCRKTSWPVSQTFFQAHLNTIVG